ncbi:calcium-binding allergen Ole e 8 [Zea mays]|jgi:hypothetical protein|uniref:Calcium-binding allergen Ole e 8 n=1 Tax=Zea mays TaxID=4577 RepID=A0A1D6GER7_MAIZE|nr:calcium-binding allergen Ole e 8 [Zea mays]AQK62075.1 Calcium-binding allergen Ole e 8 [Zea mays]|eukprot:XP_020393187.1 probable calcium-binding protein CML21 [Zea mays]
MLELLVLPPALDLLLHSCLIVSVSSLLIMLALQPLLPGGTDVASASRGVRSASRAVLARLLPSSSRTRSGVPVAPPPPPPPPRHCELCAASSWPGTVAAVTATLHLDADADGDTERSSISSAEEDGTACGGCAALAAVEELLGSKEATERELREAFRVFDRDEDGFVGAAELWYVLRRLGMGGSSSAREDCARMIAAHDADGDGRISFREFRDMMERAV